jgi:succinate dehydrogenase / fumarate reductase iron-sulfur subunit
VTPLKKTQVEVLRTDPDNDPATWVQTYEVPVVPGSSVMDVLQHIQEHIDGSLAFPCSCKVGLCAGCTVKVNGKPGLACAVPVEGDIRVEPPSGVVIRDLIVEAPDRRSAGPGQRGHSSRRGDDL